MEVDPAKLTVVLYPDPALRCRTKPVESVDETVRAVAQRMIELMYEEEGVGLAAPQVGLPWRMFVTMPPEAMRENEPPDTGRVYINPEIRVEEQEMDVLEEGCLSLPGIRTDIRRSISVTITARNLNNELFTESRNDFMARVWQHELDHLNGVLIIDKMTPMARIALRKAIKELETADIKR